MNRSKIDLANIFTIYFIHLVLNIVEHEFFFLQIEQKNNNNNENTHEIYLLCSFTLQLHYFGSYFWHSILAIFFLSKKKKKNERKNIRFFLLYLVEGNGLEFL